MVLETREKEKQRFASFVLFLIATLCFLVEGTTGHGKVEGRTPRVKVTKGKECKHKEERPGFKQAYRAFF